MVRKKNTFNLGELSKQLKEDRQQEGNPANQEAVKPASQAGDRGEEKSSEETKPDPEKSMTIKLPQSLRDYYVGKIRMEGRTVKDFLLEALVAKYGTPEEPKS